MLEHNFGSHQCRYEISFQTMMVVFAFAERVNEWGVRVRLLATKSEFGEHLGNSIRDKFVMGLEKSPSWDKIFLGESIFRKRAIFIFYI